MAWRMLTRKDIVNMMRKVSFISGGLTEEKIMHSIAEADLSLKIVDAMIEDGHDIDRQAVEAGELLHDVGLAMVGISEVVRSSPEHCGWCGWLCRKWGFPESVAQAGEGHELWTPELARRLDFPEPIQESYHPRILEAKIARFSGGCGQIVRGMIDIDPWKDPERFLSASDSHWSKEVPDDHPMIKANIGITKGMLEDRRKKALKTVQEIRKVFFPYLKKEFFTKSLKENWGHEGWQMGPWFHLPEGARRITKLDLLKMGKVALGIDRIQF